MTLDDLPNADASAAPLGTLSPLPDGGAVYGAHYYAHGFGIPYEPNDHWDQFFGGIAERVVSDLAPRTVLDAGCAIGMLVGALRRNGVDAHGLDVSAWAIEHVVDDARGYCSQGTLTEELQERYDLITCIEVIEHIPEPDADIVLANLCRATDALLISSSPTDYGEATHVNVRPGEDWAARLARHQFLRDLDFDASFITPWAALYRRSNADLAETVRSYERITIRLREEAHQLRTAAIVAQEQLQDAYAGGEIEQLRARIAQLEVEVLDERDRASISEVQLGEALGRARALESEQLRFQVAVRDLERLTQLPFWPSLARYLGLQTSGRKKVDRLLRRIGLRQ